MRAARVVRTDGPRSLEIAETPDPVPAPGEVLIEAKAAGVVFPDLLLTQDRYRYKPELPFTLGGELAGVVRAAPAWTWSSTRSAATASPTPCAAWRRSAGCW